MTGRTDNSPGARRPGLRLWSGLTVLVLLIVALGGSVAGFAALSLKPTAARGEIEAQLTALIGLPVFVAGSADFTLLPRTQITLGNIRVGGRGSDADAAMEIDALVAHLDLWEALWGRTLIESLTLIRPELLSTAGFVSETEADRPILPQAIAADDSGYQSLSRYFGAFLSRFGALRSLEIRDGVFRMTPAPGSLGISNANITVSWPSRSSSARMNGAYVWNGQPTEISAKIATPLNFLAGARTAVDVTLASPPLTASFDGEAALGGAGSFTGSLAVTTPSLTHAIRWLGDPKTALPDIGPLTLEARLDAAGDRLNLREAKVSVDGFVGLGALEMLVRDRQRPSIGGTLAFDRLDLTGFAEAVAPLPQTALDMQRPIPVDFVDGLDLDLRLSAASGAMGTLPFSDLAATVKFKEGVATLDLGDVTVLGGQAQARLSVDSNQRPPSATGVASLSGVDSARLLQALGVSSLSLSGASDIHADYSMPVTNWADLAHRSRVALSVTARNGAIGGLDPQIVANATPLAAAMVDNTIPFQTLRATLRSDGSLIDIDKLDVTGPSLQVNASGSLSAATKRLDLTGIVEPVAPAIGTAVATPPSGFSMQGIWPTPAVTRALPIRPI